MHGLPVGQKSLTQAVSRWWREWTRRGSAGFELKCCGEEEVERMAKDIGVSASQLRRLSRLCPHSAGLFLRRVAAPHPHPHQVARAPPPTSPDLPPVCTT